MAAPIGRAFRIRATITSRCRPRGSTTTSTSANITWFRFQADTGLQAAYTDPINPLFDAVSPQPLYSFAAGYTHIFSPKLVNYFNPAFSWYESLFGPTNLQQDAGGLSHRPAGHRCERALHDPRRSGQHLGAGTARQRASSSTTTWRGPWARTNFASEPTPASSA